MRVLLAHMFLSVHNGRHRSKTRPTCHVRPDARHRAASQLEHVKVGKQGAKVVQAGLRRVYLYFQALHQV